VAATGTAGKSLEGVLLVTEFARAFERLDQFIEQKMKVANVPGMAVAVTDREKLLRVSTYGSADLAAQTPVTPEMLFEIGSISKSFTSIALLQLAEEGRLDLHEPVTRYLPWFEVQSQFEPISLHHLMSHTGGIIMGMEFTGEARYEVWALRQTEATAPPGAYYHYSNLGYKALSVVLEGLLGQSYGDIIQERILDPLGMTTSEPIITHNTRERMPVGYEGSYDDRPLPPARQLAPATWLEYATGDGSIASTPADMAAYLRMLLNHGQGPRTRILSEDSFALMTQRVIEAKEEGKNSFYGYGLDLRESDGHTYVGHSGGMVGYYSYILADMNDGLGVAVSVNGPGGRCDEEIALFALRLLRSALRHQGLPPMPPVDPTKVENAAEYAGTFRACWEQGRALTLAEEAEQLVLRYGPEHIALARRDTDGFYVDHPNFALFLLRFGRENGKVVEAFHGPDWFVNDQYAGPTTFEYPQEWDAYAGHYRSHNPWLSNFRVVLRKGALALVEPSGREAPLVCLGAGGFRVGEDDRSPERIRFDTVLDGRALHANLSCGDYYRPSAPLPDLRA
jgi:CubicO group peptidase (beta-lactamase class C family)